LLSEKYLRSKSRETVHMVKEKNPQTWRNLADAAVALDDDVGGEGGVKRLVGAVVEQQVRLPHLHRGHPDILPAHKSIDIN
jgi:hypothetical protein